MSEEKDQNKVPNLEDVNLNVIDVINKMFERAMELNASDIHIEPKKHGIDIRFRVDGNFVAYAEYPASLKLQLVTRIKILAGMKIDESRLPQDGKATYIAGKQAFDLRISSLPVIYGEKIVVRILRRETKKITPTDLGLVGSGQQIVQNALKKTYGIILVAGPTGSGKSTTLYSLISSFDPKQKNISTLEDPVEYRMEGVNQSQVNTEIGFDFSTGLRTLVRQDPDIVMVGEVRDRVTAQLAVEAALTGHLVFSTIHTNTAATTIQRLIDMGIEPFLIASALELVISQRLVRRLCPFCKVPAAVEPALLSKIDKEIGHLINKPLAEVHFYRAGGCEKCNQQGYKGRMGIYEIMPISAEIERLTIQRVTANEVNQAACSEGMVSLLQDALIKAALGVTTIEEVLRTVGLSEAELSS